MRLEPDMTRWRGRVDAEEGGLGARWHQVVQALGAQTDGVALIGFACDAGVARNHGRVGAQEGPTALRAMLGNLPVRRCASIVDAGDVACMARDTREGAKGGPEAGGRPGTGGGSDAGDGPHTDGGSDAGGGSDIDGKPQAEDGLEAAQAELSEALARLLAQGLFPITLGGGHEVAFGSFGGLARHLAARPAAHDAPCIGIVNLDAHFDLRMAERASSGTPFRQIAEDCAQRGWPFRYCCLGISEFANTAALFERARRLGVTWRHDEDMEPAQLADTLATLDGFLESVDHAYLTICLDVLPASVAPGVSAPAARGVALAVVEAIVDRVAASGKLRLADLAEFNPRFDIDAHTARVAARLVARLAEAVTALRSGAGETSSERARHEHGA